MGKSIQIQFDEEVQKRFADLRDKFLLKYDRSLEKETYRQQQIKECEGIFQGEEKKFLYRVPNVVLKKEAFAYTKIYQWFIVSGNKYIQHIRTPQIEDSFNIIISSFFNVKVKNIVDGFSYYKYWRYLEELKTESASLDSKNDDNPIYGLDIDKKEFPIEVLRRLFSLLIDENLIDNSTDEETFLLCFDNSKPIKVPPRVKWRSYNNLFYYLIIKMRLTDSDMYRKKITDGELFLTKKEEAFPSYFRTKVRDVKEKEYTTDSDIIDDILIKLMKL